jgi:hypothetical protein
MMAIRDWVAPLVAAGLGAVVLPLWIWILTRINHGAVRRPRRNRRRAGVSSRLDGRKDYSVDAAFCRTLNTDDTLGRPQRTAHRLVDRAGLRNLPRDHAQHLDGLRVAGSGTATRAHVRPLAGLASPDREGVGRVSPASRQLASSSVRQVSTSTASAL